MIVALVVLVGCAEPPIPYTLYARVPPVVPGVQIAVDGVGVDTFEQEFPSFAAARKAGPITFTATRMDELVTYEVRAGDCYAVLHYDQMLGETLISERFTIYLVEPSTALRFDTGPDYVCSDDRGNTAIGVR